MGRWLPRKRQFKAGVTVKSTRKSGAPWKFRMWMGNTVLIIYDSSLLGRAEKDDG